MSRQVVSFHEGLLPAAVRLAAGGMRRTASRIGSSLLRLPDVPVEQLVEPLLRRHLPGGSEDRRAWAVVDGGELLAIAGVLVERLTPDQERYCYMPPRSVTVASSALHAVSEVAADDCYPLLLDEVRELAKSIGDAAVFVNVLPNDAASVQRWRGLGLRPGTVFARRPVAGWRPPSPPPAGLVIRVARPEDVEALTDLAREEQHYHAEHTSSGVSPEVPRATSRRVAEGRITAPAETNRQLVAENGAGRPLGAISGSILTLAEDQIQRYLLPPRYGYVGLTVVTEAARGTGVGRALIDAMIGWFAARQLETAFLHYVADNPLSSRFWARAGFVPHVEIYSM
jgi:GNAT superfamily N-acetyltransferase